eukprot:PhF_6_TR24398/c0_g1_i1/m.33765
MTSEPVQLGEWENFVVVTPEGKDIKAGEVTLAVAARENTLFMMSSQGINAVDLNSTCDVRSGIKGYYAKPLPPPTSKNIPKQSQFVVSQNDVVFVGQPMFSFNLESNIWKDGSGKACPSVDGAAVCLVGNEIFMYGGQYVDGSLTNELWKFDLLATASLQRWRPVETEGQTPSPRRDHTMIHVPGGKGKGYLVVFGGWTPGTQSPNVVNNVHVCDLDKYHWFTWTAEALGPESPPALYGHTATVVGTNMILIGGSIDTWNKNDNVYILSFEKDGSLKWRHAAVKAADAKPEPLSFHQCVVVDDRIVIHGGRNQSGSPGPFLSAVKLSSQLQRTTFDKEYKIELQKVRSSGCVGCLQSCAIM